MDLLLNILVPCLILNKIYAYEEVPPNPRNLTEAELILASRRKHLVDCADETKVNLDVILKLKSGKWTEVKSNTPNLKLWALCFLERSGMMSLQGVLKQDVVLELVPEIDRDKVERNIDKCLIRKSHLPTDIAWRYLRCSHYRYPEYSII